MKKDGVEDAEHEDSDDDNADEGAHEPGTASGSKRILSLIVDLDELTES